MCSWAARRCGESVLTVPGRTQGSGQAGRGGQTQHSWGLAPSGRCGRAPSRSLTELADVPVSGLAALVVPVEGGRCLHLHTVPEPAPRPEGGEAGRCGGAAGTPCRGQVSSRSSGHLPLVVWLPESEAGEGGWLTHVPAEGSLGCLVGETWASGRWGGISTCTPGTPHPARHHHSPIQKFPVSKSVSVTLLLCSKRLR